VKHYKQFFFVMFEHEIDYDPTKEGFVENVLNLSLEFLMQRFGYGPDINQIRKS